MFNREEKPDRKVSKQSARVNVSYPGKMVEPPDVLIVPSVGFPI